MKIESFKVPHTDYGEVTWYIINRTESELTVICSPTEFTAAFYYPHRNKIAKYIRTDFSSLRQNGENGTLYEVQNPPSPAEQDNENAQRYHDIMEYGSNQWAVSDLRKFLNNEFLKGFSDEFKNSIVPQAHDIVLSKTPTGKYTSGITSRHPTSCGDDVYDEYHGSYRLTHVVTQDTVYLPSCADLPLLRSFVQNSDAFNTPRNFWLIDAAYESLVPYLVKCVVVNKGTDGNNQMMVTSNNARYPLHVCCMCTLSISDNSENTAELNVDEWTNLEPGRIERAREVKVLAVDHIRNTAICSGSKGKEYSTSLSSCQCGDYIRNHCTCKHMIALAMALGILNEHGRNQKEQQEWEIAEAKNKLAYWYGCYHLFREPVVSDGEYDKLKREYQDIVNIER